MNQEHLQCILFLFGTIFYSYFSFILYLLFCWLLISRILFLSKTSVGRTIYNHRSWLKCTFLILKYLEWVEGMLRRSQMSNRTLWFNLVASTNLLHTYQWDILLPDSQCGSVYSIIRVKINIYLTRAGLWS